MALLRVGGLPEAALAAAAQFHAQVLPLVLKAMAASPAPLTLVFAPADHTHRAWRLAAVQALAREHAPVRVNAIGMKSGTIASEAAIAAASAYLDSAGGVTGQLLLLDDSGVEMVVSSAP